MPQCGKHPPSLPGGEIELDEAYFGGLRKGNRGRGADGTVLRSSASWSAMGLVHVILAPDVSITTLLKHYRNHLSGSSPLNEPNQHHNDC